MGMGQYHGHDHCVYGNPIKNEVALAPHAHRYSCLDDPFCFYTNQKNYTENVISSIKTRKGIIDQVRWNDDQWTYYNGRLSTATPDQSMYGEATLYPLLQVLPEKADTIDCRW